MRDSTALQPEGRSPLAELLVLALPTVAQMASYTAMQFLDVWMLTRPGVAADSGTAAANAGILTFSVISLGVGTLFIVNTLASQAFGRKDYPACGRYLWQGIWFSLLYALPLLPFCFFQLPLFHVWHEPHLAGMEDVYLRITLASVVLKLLGVATNQYLLAVNRPLTVFLGTAAGMITNAVMSYVLIFGKAGFPAMGIVGSAHAMNIGIVVETATFFAFAFLSPTRRMFHALDWKLRPKELWTLVRIGMPSGVQILADVLAWFMFCAWVMGQFGNAAMAANVIMFRYLSVSFMPAFGIGTAVTALVGRYIGAGRPDLAEHRARLGFRVAATYGVACLLMYTVFREPLIRFFHPSEEVLRIGMSLLVLASVYQFGDIVYIIYYGALRGAGDTFVPAVATASLCWSITVIGGYVTARMFPQVGPLGPWLVATGYGVILAVFMFRRWKRGGWMSIHLDPPAASAKVFDPLVTGN
ncbi:MAG TPA: MATE family efflux transporter [Tepidisphaeraceae bacterium]|jgi:MATE family multidrug resistance protein|nr:MATE family efflux transporter [Tepidisphaeraceae bacterium]